MRLRLTKIPQLFMWVWLVDSQTWCCSWTCSIPTLVSILFSPVSHPYISQNKIKKIKCAFEWDMYCESKYNWSSHYYQYYVHADMHEKPKVSCGNLLQLPLTTLPCLGFTSSWQKKMIYLPLRTIGSKMNYFTTLQWQTEYHSIFFCKLSWYPHFTDNTKLQSRGLPGMID